MEMSKQFTGFLPTPRGQDSYERRNMKTMVKIATEGGDMTLPTFIRTMALLPTPNTMDHLKPRDPETMDNYNNKRDGRKNRVAVSNLRQAIVMPQYTDQKVCAPPVLNQLTLFAEDSPASRSATPGSVREETMTRIATSGLKCFESFGKCVPDGSLRRMCRALLASKTAWYSSRCVLTWKVKATKSNRLLFQLQVSTPPIVATEYGSWRTIKTIEGMEVKIDLEDFQKVSRYKWSLCHGYARA